MLGVRVDLKEGEATRRGILSTVSQCYDPLGLIQPALLSAKIFLQGLCARGLGWDDPVSLEDRAWMKQWLVGVSSQLHCFCDASESGYGAVIYLRSVDKQECVHCSFVISRSRVTPIRTITVPRLKLVAAVVCFDLASLTCRELRLPQEACTF